MTSLNPAQQEAATTLSGPILVLAGAGAGKTKTLTHRIINLIESGILPQNILAITFTNKAAGEMKERVHHAIRENPRLQFPVFEAGFVPFVSTFHSLGVTILREQHRHIGLSKYFTIYDRSDSRSAVREAITKDGLDPKSWDTKKILSFISKNKGNGKRHTDMTVEVDDFGERSVMLSIWKNYELIKKEDNALDFDDLLLETAGLLSKNTEVRDHYRRRWTHIHIDEYQDTNSVQHQIVKELVSPDKRNIFAVGDPDQLIYGWRGAELSNIMRFEKDYPGTKTVILEQNYRSTGIIIDASNAVIAKNKNRFPKQLFTEAEPGETVGLYSAYDGREEAYWIGETIKEKIKNGVEPKEIAVLYRANFQSRLLEEACLKQSIPYQVLGTKFFDRSEVKDIMAYIQVALAPESLTSLKRIINVPKRGIGDASVVKIFAGREAELTPKTKKALQDFREVLGAIREIINDGIAPSEVVMFVIQATGMGAQYRESGKEEDVERIANMYELSEVASKYDTMDSGEGMMKFLEEVSLASDQDSVKENQNTVKLMTIHAAKGLEFDTVFLTGAEEALFVPSDFDRTSNREEKAEEERRLFYVAMTRAKKKLYLSWASMRMMYGQQESNMLCPFVVDIPQHLLSEENIGFMYKDKKFLGESEDEATIYLEW